VEFIDADPYIQFYLGLLHTHLFGPEVRQWE
jgi:hypothetical protein